MSQEAGMMDKGGRRSRQRSSIVNHIKGNEYVGQTRPSGLNTDTYVMQRILKYLRIYNRKPEDLIKVSVSLRY